MKKIGIFLMIISFGAFNTPLFAYARSVADLTSGNSRYHPSSCTCPLHSAYYGYNFPASMFDYEVDTACVDFCIDKKHPVEHCMHVCSHR